MNNQHMGVSSDHPSVSSTPCSHLMYFLGGMGNLDVAHLDPMEFSGKMGMNVVTAVATFLEAY